MPIHEIKDHDHNMQHIRKKESEYGTTHVYKCRSGGCEYKHIQFQDVQQTTMGDFGK